MKKFFKVLINTVLVLVLVCALGWYFVGDEMFGKAIADVVASDNETKPTESTVVQEEVPEETPVEEPVDEPQCTTTNIVFTGDVEISEYVQAAYNAKGIDGVASADVQSLLKDATFTMINNEFCFTCKNEF